MRGLKPPPPSVSSIPTLSQRTRRMGQPDYWLSEESNLRGGEGAEEEVGDVADEVGEAGQAGADEGVAKEDGMKAGGLEAGELAAVEHFDLADVGLLAGAFVSAHLEDAFGFGGGGRRRREAGPAGEGGEERGFDAVEGGGGGGGVPEGISGFEKGGVTGEAESDLREGFDRGGGDEQIVGRRLNAEVGLECADGAEAEAGEGGDERVGEVTLGEGGLRAGV